MKAEFDGLKGSDGEIRLFPESIDDIWHIKHLIRTGDLIFADTFRSLDSQTDKTRPEKTEKKPVRLGLRVEKTEFHPDTIRLRISGVIEQAPPTPVFTTPSILNRAGKSLSLNDGRRLNGNESTGPSACRPPASYIS